MPTFGKKCPTLLASTPRTAEVGLNKTTLKGKWRCRCRSAKSTVAKIYHFPSNVVLFRSWELRATVSLARLLAREGHSAEAYTMLTEIYNRFTEGFNTADLKDAKALLDELRA
jgi:predicted ATPase